MKGSADSTAVDARLPRTARGSPGAAIAGPARRRRAAAVRAGFIATHLRLIASQRRCQRLGRRRAVLLAPAAPVLQSAGELCLQTSIGGSIVAPASEWLGQMFLIPASVRRIQRV